MILLSTATILHARAAKCQIPLVPKTLEPGLRSLGKSLIISLILETDNSAEFGMVLPAEQQSEKGGRVREDVVWLLNAPPVLTVRVSHKDLGQHGDLATLDRLAL